jgi:hypothetical protein
MGGHMTRQRPLGSIMKFLERNHFWRERLYFLVLDIFLVGSLGLGGQESSQNPRAREPDKLLLVGWVVSRFWVGFGQSIRLGKAVERTTIYWDNSIRQRYFYL